jgi:hypothetical protein
LHSEHDRATDIFFSTKVLDGLAYNITFVFGKLAHFFYDPLTKAILGPHVVGRKRIASFIDSFLTVVVVVVVIGCWGDCGQDCIDHVGRKRIASFFDSFFFAVIVVAVIDCWVDCGQGCTDQLIVEDAEASSTPSSPSSMS